MDIPDGIKPSAFKTVMREKILRPLMINHINQTLGKHFKDVPENQPGGAYGVKPRSRVWNEVKRKRFGHTIANLATGHMQRNIRNLTLPTVRATSARATSTLRAPNRTKKGSNRNFSMSPQQRKELAALSDREVLEMNQRAIEIAQREFAKPENQSRRKRRI